MAEASVGAFAVASGLLLMTTQQSLGIEIVFQREGRMAAE
jgi:hypothetical protein